ncbi:MAG: hypothetical protein WA419_07520 [Silvibacterium sp.]
MLTGVIGCALAADDSVHVDDDVDAALGGLIDGPVKLGESVGAPS